VQHQGLIGQAGARK
jgi:hypothetical protein